MEGKDVRDVIKEETDGLYLPVLKKDNLRLGRMDREQVLVLTSDLITYLHRRSCGPRFREFPTDRIRMSYQRVMISAIAVYGGVLRDTELDELKRRIEALEMVKGKEIT
jgi:hypothetical protein